MLGSALGRLDDLSPFDLTSDGTLSLLQDAEGNHCSSFPAVLLQLLRAGANLSQDATAPDDIWHRSQQALHLLYAAQSFDPLAWADDVQLRSPRADRLARAYLAIAHRAAVCIYLSRISQTFDRTIELPRSFELLVADSVTYLSFIGTSDPLFTATAWPTFVAGAETKDPVTQAWASDRFRQLWKIEPWGIVSGALNLMETIWQQRTQKAPSEDDDWISDLRSEGIDWLIA